MPAPSVSDAEFIKLWHQFKGDGRRLAEALGVDEGHTWKRRRRIEQRHNTVLPAGDRRPDMAAKYQHLAPKIHARQVDLGIEDGVVIVFSDAHYWPGLITTAHRAVVKFCQELQPKAVVCNGDAFDGAAISRHDPIGFADVPSVREELAACEMRLGEIWDASQKAKHLWCLGNHDERFENRLARVAPEFAGVGGFSIAERFPDWKTGRVVLNGTSTVIKHRFKSGIHAPHNNAMWSGRTMVTGHLHSLKVQPITDYNGTRWGVDCGTLAEPYGPQFEYTEAAPVNWRSGFVVLTYWKGQLLQPETVRVLAPGVVDFRGHAIEVAP